MGACFGVKFIVNEFVPGQGSNVIVTAGKLKLRREDINSIFRGFCELDVDRSGLISAHEFIVLNQVQSAAFGELAFRVLDRNNSGKIDFLEYMVALWNYCSMNRDSLALFTFKIFDTDDSGIMSIAEFKAMIDIVWGFCKSDHVETLMKTLDKNHDGEITLKEFLQMVHHTPVLLFPGFELQEKLRKSVLGPMSWARISKERSVAYGDGTVFEIVQCNLETDEEYRVAKTIDVTNKDPKAPAGFADRVRRMSIERRQKKQAIQDAIANNEAIEAGVNRRDGDSLPPVASTALDASASPKHVSKKEINSHLKQSNLKANQVAVEH